MTKLNFDGAICTKEGVRVVVRDNKGQFMGALAVLYVGLWEAGVVEMHVLLLGSYVCKFRGYQTNT